MSEIEKRLSASLKYGAMSGDAHEQAVVATQIGEAIREIRNLRAALAKAEAERDSAQRKLQEAESFKPRGKSQDLRDWLVAVRSSSIQHELTLAGWKAETLPHDLKTAAIEIEQLHAERDALKQDIEDRDRAIESLRLKVDTAHGQIDALNARAEAVEKELEIKSESCNVARLAVEKLKARAERLVAECRSWRASTHRMRIASQFAGDVWQDIRAARAAVDAHGDLEVPK